MDDVQRLAAEKFAHGFNIKLMKHGGVGRSLELIAVAQAAGLLLMIGGMIDSRLAMTASAQLAAALGGAIVWCDLDTPLLIARDGLRGGITYDGGKIFLPDGDGIGVQTVRR